MKRIISVSRRTDIPAFYPDWFMRRVDAGFAGWENPFGGRKILVSLLPEDVMAFVFWSKNYRPFLPHLQTINKLGIPVMFNYTITGLPQIFESNLVKPADAIDSLKELSRVYSSDHINWRYDPIVLSSVTDESYHLETFRRLAESLKGYVKRCYFSFAVRYGKVERNFRKFEYDHQVGFFELEQPRRIALANKLAEIAATCGIKMYSCCGDYLINSSIYKAHCIDGEILEQLYPHCRKGSKKPTRKECGCTESTDLGKYDTCPHGCIYCYANINKQRAEKLHAAHDPESAFLGYTKSESDRFLLEIAQRTKAGAPTNTDTQPKLF